MLRIILSKWTVAAAFGLASVGWAFAPEEPTITSHPQGLIVSRGSTVTFSVTATGDARPIQYRWRRGGATVKLGPDPTLVITNADVGANATYTVIVSYSGTRGVLSKLAPLSFLDVSRGDDGIGVNLNGALPFSTNAPFVYEIQYVTSPNDTNWTTVTNITFTNTPVRWIDPEAGLAPQRFYRAVMQPF